MRGTTWSRGPWRRVSLWCALLLAPGVLACATPDDGGGVSLRLGIASPSGGQAGLFAAYEAGLFEAEGLDVELVIFPRTGDGAQALVRSDIGICSGIGAPFVNAVLNGAPLVGIAELLGTMPSSLVARRGIETVDELRGGRIGIPNLGGNGYFGTRLALREVGLDPERDVTLVPTGSVAPRLAAVVRGDVRAVLLSPPAIFMARNLGLTELVDLRTLRVEYPFEPLVVRRHLIDERPEVLVRLIRAAVRGARYFKTHREQGIALLEQYLHVDDQEALAEAYAYFAETIQERPFLSDTAMRLALREVASTTPAAGTAPPSRFIDMRFVHQLEREGFFEAGPRPESP